MFIQLGVSGHTLGGKPAVPTRSTKVGERARVELIELSTLVKAGQRLAAMHDHVGAGIVLEHCAGAPPLFGNGI